MAEDFRNLITGFYSGGSAWLIAFDGMINLVAAVLEHLLGMLGGALAGLLAGRFIGRIYASHIEPLHFEDLHELAEWTLIPDAFARYGAAVGAVVGLLVVVLLHRRLLEREALTHAGTGVADTQGVLQGPARPPAMQDAVGCVDSDTRS
jgi:hypothetical protein